MSSPKAIRRLKDFLGKTPDDALFLKGTVGQGNRRCGKKGCKCRRGGLHPKRKVFGYFKDNKFHMRTIPYGKEHEFHRGLRRQRTLSKLLKDLVRESQERVFLPIKG